MSAPNPTIVDTFTYADGVLDTLNPTAWHDLSFSPMSVWSNEAGPPAGAFGNFHEMYRPLFLTDCEAALTLAIIDANTWVYVRLQNIDTAPGWASPPLGYYVRYDSGASTLTLHYGSGDVSTSITLAPGDKICCRAIGFALSAWVFTGGGWRNLLNATDAGSNYPSGRTGFSQGRSATSISRIDDFAVSSYPDSSTTGTGTPVGVYPVFQVTVSTE